MYSEKTGSAHPSVKVKSISRSGLRRVHSLLALDNFSRKLYSILEICELFQVIFFNVVHTTLYVRKSVFPMPSHKYMGRNPRIHIKKKLIWIRHKMEKFCL